MANIMKAADLIGKVIILGENVAKYIVKSVDGDKLSCDFLKEGMASVPMSVSFQQVEKFLKEGKWTVSKTEAATVINGVVVATEEHHDLSTDADVEEVDDIVPVVTPKKAEPKEEKKEEPKPVKAKEKKPAPKPKKEVKKADGKLVYTTYQNKKGKQCARITGFSEEDEAYKRGEELHGSASYERDKEGGKVFYLCFGPRYQEAAKEVCDLLNEGKSFKDCVAIIDKATGELATKREEWKQKREERKASGVKSKKEKTYTLDEVAEMLGRLLPDGAASKEDVKKLLEAA